MSKQGSESSLEGLNRTHSVPELLECQG